MVAENISLMFNWLGFFQVMQEFQEKYGSGTAVRDICSDARKVREDVHVIHTCYNDIVVNLLETIIAGRVPKIKMSL